MSTGPAVEPGPEGAAPPRKAARAFAILNPASGGADRESVRLALARYQAGAWPGLEVHETTPEDDVGALVRGAVDRGVDLVIAAGGDGTVGATANGLVGTEVPLAIIPLGTANVLARELGVPLDVEEACALAVGPHAVRSIDAMRVAGRYYFTQVGVGIDSLMIRDTSREQKRRFGRVAYIWTALTRLMGFQPRRFRISVDSEEGRPRRASQVVVANVGAMGDARLHWGPNIRLDDGRLDLCVVNARTALDYLVISWDILRGQHRRNRHLRYLSASKTITLEADRPIPVQADGEIIGETPVTIEVVPDALRVAIPPAGPAAGSG